MCACNYSVQALRPCSAATFERSCFTCCRCSIMQWSTYKVECVSMQMMHTSIRENKQQAPYNNIGGHALSIVHTTMCTPVMYTTQSSSSYTDIIATHQICTHTSNMHTVIHVGIHTYLLSRYSHLSSLHTYRMHLIIITTYITATGLQHTSQQRGCTCC